MSKLWNGVLNDLPPETQCDVPSLVAALPDVLTQNRVFGALAQAIAKQLVLVDREIENVLIFPRIDELSEELLDILAYDMHVDWYDYDAAIETKRIVLKNSVAVHKHLGTVWAVENVIRSYFGTGYVKEWFDYDGRPGYFRIYSSNPAITGEKFHAFFDLLYKVKRESAKLDAVIIELESTGTLTYGICHEMSGSMDVYPLVPREIETGGTLVYDGCHEMGESADIYPLVPRAIETGGSLAYRAVSEPGGTRKILPQISHKVETTGAAARTGVLTGQGTLEIFPSFPSKEE